MSQRKRSSCSGPLPDISTASIRQLTALPAEVLLLHLSNYHLTTTDTKAVMARQLFDAIHTVSSITTTSPTNLLTSSATMTTYNSQSSPGNAAQLFTLLQLLT